MGSTSGRLRRRQSLLLLRAYVVDSTEGIITLYAHLESIAVAEGQRVRQRQPLGVVGCTGHCTGTHLHFEVIDNGVRRDPLSHLP